MRASRFFSIAMAAVFILFLTAENLFAAPAVDWSKQMITVTGMGFAPEGNYTPAHSLQLAKRAAINEAYRQLAEVVNGVKVTGETTVSNLTLVSDIIKTKVEATIKGAKQISERETGDGGYEVTLQMPLFGKANSLAGVVLEKPAQKEPFPEPVPGVLPSIPNYTAITPVKQRIDIVITPHPTTQVVINRSANYSAVEFTPMSSAEFSPLQITSQPQVFQPQIQMPTQPQIPQIQLPTVQPVEENNLDTVSGVTATGGYTGLIVDCREKDLQPVMSPTIHNEHGDTIYGDKNLDYDKIIEIGMVSYATDIEDEVVERAGKNPLVVKAVELKKFSSSPVLTDADANRILLENKVAGFLEKLNVIFIM